MNQNLHSYQAYLRDAERRGQLTKDDMPAKGIIKGMKTFSVKISTSSTKYIHEY